MPRSRGNIDVTDGTLEASGYSWCLQSR